jgi:hypothetical protein
VGAEHGSESQAADEDAVRERRWMWLLLLPVRHVERQDAQPSSCRPSLIEHRKSTQYSLKPTYLHRPYEVKNRPAWSF